MQSFVRGRDKLAPYADTTGMRRRDLLTLASSVWSPLSLARPMPQDRMAS
jgi:hypothetical protein